MQTFRFPKHNSLKFIFSIVFLLIISIACNDENTRRNEIISTIESAGDFNPDMLSEEDQALIADYNVDEGPTNEGVKVNLTKVNESTTKQVVNKALANRKLIKTGSLRYETQDIKKSRIIIEQLVKKHNAFISNEQSNNYSHQTEQNLSIRIPFLTFDAFVSDLSGSVVKFDHKTINVKDVTEEYIDIQSRLKAKYKLEESYLALLKKALKIKDILEIEKELNNVRTEIESMEGRLRFLKDQVSLSTLNIVFYKTLNVEYAKEKGFFSKLWYNFQSGFGSLLQIILGIVSIWPILLILSTIAYLLGRWWKKRK